MHVSSITDQGGFGASAAHPTKKTNASFQDYLSSAGAGTTSAAQSGTTTGSTASSPEQTFEDYMSETPAQRMFDSWLGSQRITKEQYAALSPEEKQKLVVRFEQYLKEKMEEKVGTFSSGTSAVA